MDPQLVKIAVSGLVLLGCIGLFFGVGLAIAAHKFAVETDPLIDKVLHSLPQAQCGGCGYAGCEGYAIAVVTNPDVPPNLCFPGKEAVAAVVAELTGKKVVKVEDQMAVVRCSRVEGRVGHKHQYLGFQSCTAADLAFGGPFQCRYACIGMGECAAACPFGAITMVDDFPVIDPDKCVGCGVCVRSCPKKIIELQTLKARVMIPCSSQDPGKEVKAVCAVGCISCTLCVKVCPAQAVSFVGNRIVIDHKACIASGPSCEEVCVSQCPRRIFRPFQGRHVISRSIDNGLKMAG